MDGYRETTTQELFPLQERPVKEPALGEDAATLSLEARQWEERLRTDTEGDVESWTSNEVNKWLHKIGFEQLIGKQVLLDNIPLSPPYHIFTRRSRVPGAARQWPLPAAAGRRHPAGQDVCEGRAGAAPVPALLGIAQEGVYESPAGMHTMIETVMSSPYAINFTTSITP